MGYFDLVSQLLTDEPNLLQQFYLVHNNDVMDVPGLQRRLIWKEAVGVLELENITENNTVVHNFISSNSYIKRFQSCSIG